MQHVFGPAAVGAQQPPPAFGLTFDCIYGLHDAPAATRMMYVILVPGTMEALFFILAIVGGALRKSFAEAPFAQHGGNAVNTLQEKISEGSRSRLSCPQVRVGHEKP